MGKEAVGAYIVRLREHANMSRHGLARKVGASDSLLIRIERGEETRASLMAAIIRVLNASAEDVVELYVTPEATPEDGRTRADAWVERPGRPGPGEGRGPIRREVDELVERLTDYELGKWVALGERIITERSKTR